MAHYFLFGRVVFTKQCLALL